MVRLDVTRDEWLRCDGRAARAIADRIGQTVGADRVDVRQRALGPHLIWNAFFHVADVQFGLVPGGEVTLGFAADQFLPTADELASFRAIGGRDPLARPASARTERGLQIVGQLDIFTSEEAESPRLTEPKPAEGDFGDLTTHLANNLTPARRATIPAFLIAIEPQEAGAVEVETDHPLVRAHRPWAAGTLVADDEAVRIEYSLSGDATRAWLIRHQRHADLKSELATRGWRLPKPDEWEYAFGLGFGTLFPWGNRFPLPRHGQPDQYLLPDGAELDLGLGGVLGLLPSEDGPEVTSRATEVRGGHPGESRSRFYSWLPAASAWRSAADNKRLQAARSVRGCWYRPVIAG